MSVQAPSAVSQSPEPKIPAQLTDQELRRDYERVLRLLQRLSTNTTNAPKKYSVTRLTEINGNLQSYLHGLNIPPKVKLRDEATTLSKLNTTAEELNKNLSTYRSTFEKALPSEKSLSQLVIILSNDQPKAFTSFASDISNLPALLDQFEKNSSAIEAERDAVVKQRTHLSEKIKEGIGPEASPEVEALIQRRLNAILSPLAYQNQIEDYKVKHKKREDKLLEIETFWNQLQIMSRKNEQVVDELKIIKDIVPKLSILLEKAALLRNSVYEIWSNLKKGESVDTGKAKLKQTYTSFNDEVKAYHDTFKQAAVNLNRLIQAPGDFSTQKFATGADTKRISDLKNEMTSMKAQRDLDYTTMEKQMLNSWNSIQLLLSDTQNLLALTHLYKKSHPIKEVTENYTTFASNLRETRKNENQAQIHIDRFDKAKEDYPKLESQFADTASGKESIRNEFINSSDQASKILNKKLWTLADLRSSHFIYFGDEAGTQLLKTVNERFEFSRKEIQWLVDDLQKSKLAFNTAAANAAKEMNLMHGAESYLNDEKYKDSATSAYSTKTMDSLKGYFGTTYVPQILN